MIELAPRPAHAAFLSLVPRLQTHARVRFRHLRPVDREEAVAEVVAYGFASFLRLKERDKDPATFPAVFAHFVARAVANGRRVVRRPSARDLLARPRGGRVAVHKLDDPMPGGGWWRDAALDRRVRVDEQAAFNIDFPAWLATLPAPKRRVAELLARGHGTDEAASRTGLSPAACRNCGGSSPARGPTSTPARDPRRPARSFHPPPVHLGGCREVPDTGDPMSVSLSHLVLDRPLAVLDLETTGVDPAADRVVELAVLTLVPCGRQELFHRRVNPGVSIPPAATAVHGITDADVAAAPPFAAVAPELFATLHGSDLAGFGIGTFDLPLLAAEFARCGFPFRVARRRVIDVLTLYRRWHPRNLASAVREYLGRDHVDAHSAAADARAAAEVLDRLVGRHALPPTPAGLHASLVEVDVAGRFRRDTRRVVFAFGKYSGQPLGEVAARDPGYLRWVLGRPFLDDVHDLVRRALAGE
jgi:DNA polymerase-3 subunit epsilon